MKPRRALAHRFAILSLLMVSPCGALAAEDWKPIDPAQLGMTTPVVEKDADAEALFWEVQVDFSSEKKVFLNYVRIKIFTERGKELRSKVELSYSSKNKIEDIVGRTIKANGTIVELTKEAIFERTLVKLRGIKINAKTFVMPAVEPGAIIEYRWREVRGDSSGYFARLSFQREIPMRLVKYTLKAPSDAFSGFRTKPFNMPDTPMVPEKDKRFSYTMTNVHAFHEEPHMPPEDQVRPWLLAYYDPPMFVMRLDINKSLFDDFKSRTKANDEVKRAAVSAIGDATTSEQKLERLFEFCRTKIKDVNDDASGLSAIDREKFKENKTAADTLKRGVGTGEDIDLLFAALAAAAGFEARLAHLADRSDIFFSPNAFQYLLNMYFMRSYNIAVRVGNDWRFFDPASSYIPFGMLRWQEEGGQALIVDPGRTLFVPTPVSSPEKSLQRRTAELRLSEDGAPEGNVRMEYTGHFAVEKKEENDAESPEEREKTLRDMIKKQMSTAELSNIRIENVTDPAKPFIYTFHVRVPGYAQRTGKRLFLQPAFFQRGKAALFSASERKHQIYFHYSWMEKDQVTIDLPAGFVLDHAEQPMPFNASNVAKYEVKIGVVGKGEALQLNRTFTFDGLIFPVQSYAGLKKAFDALHDSDNHTITLKQAAAKQ